ncbi:CinA family protein [Nevskia sp.]|uniref:CinA family protein n=1 Tax=Nevskia sp. TaxID=1929292 RepID=UPI0025E4C3E8|nr:CinA family protein [Nevskia sp.]
MQPILELGARAAVLLKARGERIAVAETSAGGLISAGLLAVPGASTFFVGGAITYSARSIRALAGLTLDDLQAAGIRSSSEPYAALLAKTIRERHGDKVIWGLSETGAAGPDGNRYGDPAGHTCFAVSGPVTLVRSLRTGRADRFANMQAFAAATLALLIEALEAAPDRRA